MKLEEMLKLEFRGIAENAIKKKREKHFDFHQSGKISEPGNTVSARPVGGGSLQVSRGVATVPAVSAGNPKMLPREVARCPKTHSREGVSDKVTAFPSRPKPPSLPSWWLNYPTTTGLTIFCSYGDTRNKRVSLEVGSELSEDPRHTRK